MGIFNFLRGWMQGISARNFSVVERRIQGIPAEIYNFPIERLLDLNEPTHRRLENALWRRGYRTLGPILLLEAAQCLSTRGIGDKGWALWYRLLEERGWQGYAKSRWLTSERGKPKGKPAQIRPWSRAAKILRVLQEHNGAQVLLEDIITEGGLARPGDHPDFTRFRAQSAITHLRALGYGIETACGESKRMTSYRLAQEPR